MAQLKKELKMVMSADNNVYYKKGKKYYPFGIQANYIPDGIWLIVHEPHSSSRVNVDHYLASLYRLGDVPKPIDIPKLCSIERYADYFLKSDTFTKIRDGECFSWKELVAHLITAILEVNEQIKNNSNIKQNGTR